MYRKGQGVGQDYKQAHFWYRKAADRGGADAQRALRLLREHEVNQQLEAVRRNQRQIQAQQDEMLQ